MKPDRHTAIGSLDLCGANLCFFQFKLELLEMMGNMAHHYASTKAFAGAMDVEEQTILAAHSRAGHYCGIRPIKLPNRRLAWPVAAIEKLFSASDNHSMTEA